MATERDEGWYRNVIRTPDQRLRVFVSSTLQELAPERAAARDAISQLRLVPVMFELGARPHPPRDLYRAYLHQSHVFVGIYWQRYGWVAPDMEISGLEDEYVLAGGHPKLVYIKQPAPDRDPELDALLDRIRDDGSTSYRPFSTPEELRELLENDLAVMLTERFEETDASAGGVAAPDTAPDLVPHPPSPLVGRDLEVSALRDLLTRGDVRLVTVTGPGGSGKTRLAIELAELEKAERNRRVCFVDLTGLRSADMVLPTIASALGVRDAGDRSLVDAIGSVLADTSRLLVVDNFEHVMDAAACLSEILTVTSGVTILVTSRQPLRLRWEHEYPLHPLDVPKPGEDTGPDAVAASSAVELLVQRARRVRPDFDLTDDNAASIAEIARRLDGLPLALELAAARLRLLGPAELLARLEHRLDTLSGRTRDAPDRHRTLREAISWSHDLLTDDEQALFRRLGVFAGGASLEAIESVCCGDGVDTIEVLDLIGGLVDKSLVVSSTDEASGQMRFSLLETIREYAMEELVAAGETEAVFDRHLEWCTVLAERSFVEVWTSNMQAWLDVLDREHDNLRLGLDHAAGSGDPVRGLRVAHSLWPFWDIHGHYREGERRLRTLLDLAPTEPSTPRGRALSALGWLNALLGDFEGSYQMMLEGLDMVRATGEPVELAWTLGEIGNVAFSLALADEAEAYARESLEIARSLDHTLLVGWNVFGLAYVEFLRGDLAAMKSLLDEALVLSRRVYQPWAVAWAVYSLGVVAIMTGDLKSATADVTEALGLRWSIGDMRGTTDCFSLLAYLASQQGQLEWSARLHGVNDVQREAVGLTRLPFLQPLEDESMALLRDRLGPAEVERLWHEGRGAPVEKIVAEAMQERRA
jgi:predicted ATPase